MVFEDRDWTWKLKCLLGKNTALTEKWMHVHQLKYQNQRHRTGHELAASTW